MSLQKTSVPTLACAGPAGAAVAVATVTASASTAVMRRVRERRMAILSVGAWDYRRERTQSDPSPHENTSQMQRRGLVLAVLSVLVLGLAGTASAGRADNPVLIGTVGTNDAFVI